MPATPVRCISPWWLCTFYVAPYLEQWISRAIVFVLADLQTTSGDVIETTGANTDTYWSRFFCYYKYLSGTQRFFILHNLLILYNDVGNLKGRYQNKFLLYNYSSEIFILFFSIMFTLFWIMMYSIMSIIGILDIQMIIIWEQRNMHFN